MRSEEYIVERPAHRDQVAARLLGVEVLTVAMRRMPENGTMI